MPSLVFLLGLSTVLAGPAQDIAREVADSTEPPAFGIACAPIREAVQLADALGSFSSGPVRPELQLLLNAARDPSVHEVDGINVDGGFAMVSGPGGATASLPMTGDLQAAMALFLPESRDDPGWTLETDRAERTEPDGTVRSLSVDGRQARLQVRSGEKPVGASSAVAPPALVSLPDASGCALWMQPTPRAGSAPSPLRSPVAVWVPFDDASPMRVHMQLPAHRDRADEPVIRAPVSVSTATRPHAVITLGVPLMSIVRDPFVLDSLPPALREKLPEPGVADDLGAGMVVGTFLSPSGPMVLAVLPIEGRSGRPVSARRIWKVASNALVQVQSARGAPPPQRVGRRALQVQVTPKHQLVLQAARGRVYLGNVRSQVEAMARSEGEPWLSPEQADWSTKHAFALFADAPLPGLSTPLAVQLGAGTRGNLMSVELMMAPGLSDPEVAEALRAFTASRKARDKPSLPMKLPQ